MRFPNISGQQIHSARPRPHAALESSTLGEASLLANFFLAHVATLFRNLSFRRRLQSSRVSILTPAIPVKLSKRASRGDPHGEAERQLSLPALALAQRNVRRPPSWAQRTTSSRLMLVVEP